MLSRCACPASITKMGLLLIHIGQDVEGPTQSVSSLPQTSPQTWGRPGCLCGFERGCSASAVRLIIGYGMWGPSKRYSFRYSKAEALRLPRSYSMDVLHDPMTVQSCSVCAMQICSGGGLTPCNGSHLSIGRAESPLSRELNYLRHFQLRIDWKRCCMCRRYGQVR